MPLNREWVVRHLCQRFEKMRFANVTPRANWVGYNIKLNHGHLLYEALAMSCVVFGREAGRM
jgi:hypothetical protein